MDIVPALNSLLRVWRKTGPFIKTAPATIKVAPVSERDLANARENAAINDGFMMGKVTVREAVKWWSAKSPRCTLILHLVIKHCTYHNSDNNWE